MTIIQTDSRRLTGPNLLSDRAGAVLDVALPEPQAEAAIAAWTDAVGTMLRAIDWSAEEIRVRRFAGGANLAISAPIDALYAATEVTEWALAAANAVLAGTPIPDLAQAGTRLRQLIDAERRPAVLALSRAASSRGVTFLVDEALVSVGTGTGVRCWPVAEAPSPEAVEWSAVHDVPTVLVTGSNGKTTTVRLLAAILSTAGKVPGFCCSDSVSVGDESLAEGDWSGPGGARMVLRDPRVQVAVLETARGGILRRGLAVRRADAAIVTNIAADHMGEFGVSDLESLAETKLVVRRALGTGGRLVLNADDPVLVRHGVAGQTPIIWFGLTPGNPVFHAHLRAGGEAALLEEDRLILAREGQRFPLARLADLPMTLGGAARHNIANALGSAALAAGIGVPPDVIAAGLTAFRGGPNENPGRLNLFSVGGVTAVVDYAHNPHGMTALVASVAALPATRRLILMGQAGDRDDQALRALARSAWPFAPDRIVLKEMAQYRRGRAPGEIGGIMREEFLRMGATPETITEADSEFAAVHEALAWARPGDLLLLTVHSDRERVLALLDGLRTQGWRAGNRVPS